MLAGALLAVPFSVDLHCLGIPICTQMTPRPWEGRQAWCVSSSCLRWLTKPMGLQELWGQHCQLRPPASALWARVAVGGLGPRFPGLTGPASACPWNWPASSGHLGEGLPELAQLPCGLQAPEGRDCGEFCSLQMFPSEWTPTLSKPKCF